MSIGLWLFVSQGQTVVSIWEIITLMDSSHQIFLTAFGFDSRAFLIIRSLEFYEIFNDVRFKNYTPVLFVIPKIFHNKTKPVDVADPGDVKEKLQSHIYRNNFRGPPWV